MSTPICLRALLSRSLAGLFLPISIAAAGSPATVTLDHLVQTYDGTAKVPGVTTEPPSLNVSLRYFDPAVAAAQPIAETVYNNTPGPLGLSYSSLSFSSQGTCGLGDRVQLAGTARALNSVDVVLVTWAKASAYPSLAMADPTGWHHPVKMSIYDMDTTGSLSLKGEITQSIFVPWRPLTYPGYSVYPYNGFAFQAHFDFPAGLVLPEKPVFLVSYNTSSSGFEPIGVPGPYDALNVASGDGPTTGTDDNPSAALWVRAPSSWVYPAVGTRPPMIVVKASATPELGSITPPVNAGTYRVVAKISDPDFVGESAADLTIQPAAAQIELGNLVQVADGTPKWVTATTVPSGIPVSLTYDGAVELPSKLGRLAVHATIQDPNYVGSADADLLLGQSLQSWMGAWVQNGLIPVSETGPHDDPDHDSIDNLLEYAMGLDPSSPNTPSTAGNGTPVAEFNAKTLSLIYRKNLLATDLVYEVQTTTQIGGSETWEPASTVESIVSTDGSIQTIRAQLPPQTNENHRFVRLSVVRQ